MAFSGEGYRLGDENVGAIGRTSAHDSKGVPSLKDICLSTLDRYIDLLEDIGTTPYYLIESILRKCNVKQLTRVELHTEGLDEYTDELWYIHAKNDFKAVREGWPEYDESGEWRSKYQAMKQEDEDRLERKRALLRQAYSQHDKVKQDRRVIMDPNLRLPKKVTKPSLWSNTAPKKKSLFEKARLEARRITQMYNSSPYPSPRNRPSSSISSKGGSSSNSASNITSSRRILAPTSTPVTTTLGPVTSRNDPVLITHGAAVNSTSSSNAATALAPASTRGKRYSYKTRPVVYTSLSKPLAQTQDISEGFTTSPSSIRPTTATTSANAFAHKVPIPSVSGAIVDFFKEINPTHSQHITASKHHHVQADSRSRSPASPTSAAEPPSETIQMLREDAGTASHYKRSTESSNRRRDRILATATRLEGTKAKKGLEGLEDDDSDNYNIEYNDVHRKDFPHPRVNHHTHTAELTAPKKKDNDSKAPVSLEEAGRQFFNQLIGKSG
ncbi:RNA polymerase II transcription factor SIII subunit A-domain-containing protein [Lobosporangium transversale]|uniref:RNA polymerase II transcription factor SIII subunit A-domain-containing protein n=1 Tax=Lobosporangium transversale TaxID=64571 RepID=A0A1Y2GM80_9FUNG|nr:RNA polymerase II transcription factor SIII subunit A-domain-containing protein [Lobosporangium transversale]ORZ15406.1 RNA polymerase II transcription factor SIII subunit A-domain-containing protein [Lobosporangium transversale]|eukprot:XP_021881154.1 RNA polymerase II transcription factor SIII subunit A-domain-containing protein [Lobosporangium transversale]